MQSLGFLMAPHPGIDLTLIEQHARISGQIPEQRDAREMSALPFSAAVPG